LGEHPIATAEIENALSWEWIEQVEHGLAECGDKGSISSVAGSIPGLRGHWDIVVAAKPGPRF